MHAKELDEMVRTASTLQLVLNGTFSIPVLCIHCTTTPSNDLFIELRSSDTPELGTLPLSDIARGALEKVRRAKQLAEDLVSASANNRAVAVAMYTQEILRLERRTQEIGHVKPETHFTLKAE